MKRQHLSSAPVLVALASALISPAVFAQTIIYTNNAQFDSASASPFNNTVDTNPANQIVLGPSEVSKTTLLWVDNYRWGWIVRIDTSTGKQTARFDSALQFINGKATGALPSKEYCDFATTGNCPGRVAVDGNGDVWIINRAFGHQGTLSKFSGNINHCIDRNNNGVIDTSRDVNGDGVVNPADTTEYLAQGDECILTTIPIGAVNDWPRGVAVDKKGKIWVSTNRGSKVYRFNPNEPVALEATISVAGKSPYSMATGGDYVYLSNSNTGPTRIHIDTLVVQHATGANCAATYGVVAEPTAGNVAWFGGHTSGTGLLRVDWTSGTAVCTRTATTSTITAVTLDLQNPPQVWGAGYTGNQICRFTMAGALLNCYPNAPGTSNPHGLSVDFKGDIFQVNDGGPVTKFSTSGAVLTTLSIGAPPAMDYTPYLYSDFTGTQIHRQAPYGRLGSWTAQYDGGAPAIPWLRVGWNTEAQGAIPTETKLTVSARAADSQAALGTGAYSAVGNNVALSGLKGRYVEVKVDMAGPGYKTPVLSDLFIKGPCDTIGKNCCVKPSDCDDGNSCTEDVCPVPGGACSYKPIAECCQTSADCNDNNGCTTDTCPAPGGLCSHAKQANCCTSNADCDDSNPCSTDLCSGPGGKCQNPLINGCCLTDIDCTKGNPCSDAKCDSPGSLCKDSFIKGCCTSDANCADNDLCTTDTCDTSVNTCANAKISGCCNKDQDCFDPDTCTDDRCSGPGGQCTFPTIANCCTDKSPEVGTPCDIPVSPNDNAPCKAGKLVCTANKFVCQDSVTPKTEVCDGIDNDCNGNTDAPNPCPTGQQCVTGYCAKPCGGGEFQCPTGQQCVNNLCMPTTCDSIHCPAGTTCVSGNCVTGDGGTAGAGGAGGSSTDGGQAGKDGGQAGTDGGAAGKTDGGATDGAATDSSADSSVGGSGGDSTKDQNWGQATGGGGCKCNVADTRSTSYGALAMMGLAFAVSSIRRRRSGGAR